MGKHTRRKLNRQQQRRVQQRRDGQALSPQEKANARSGLVITNFGKRVMVEDETGRQHNCAIRQNLGKLVAGDRVLWTETGVENEGVVIALEPRQSVLARPGFRGQDRMIAANIDRIGIVAPLNPGVHPDMIDRYLVACCQQGFEPLLIINKTDLIETEEDWEALAETLLTYDELELPIFPVSAQDGSGLDALREALKDHTSVFVGPSGAGKSSLIKALIPDIDIRIGALSEATGLGKHTTTNSILYHLPEGGDLIDSPGVRLFSPQKPENLKALEACFPELHETALGCRFNNCTHTDEPGCAVMQAVQDGEIAFSRYHSFQRLREEFGL